MKKIEVAGELLTTKQCGDLMRMLCHDAEQIAGVFHGENRSDKFRANWPDEDLFVKANWKTFVAAARSMYAERLADPHTPEADKKKIHQCLVLQAMLAQGEEGDNRLQLRPNTQQFLGDRAENRKIMDTYGKTRNVRAALLNGMASIPTHH